MLSNPLYPTAPIQNTPHHSLSMHAQTCKEEAREKITSTSSTVETSNVGSVLERDNAKEGSKVLGDYLMNDEERALRLRGNAVRIGSRKSQLAVIQSEIVAKTINEIYPHIRTPVIKVSTLGDQIQSKPLYTFGGKALWTKELEVLLLESVGDFPQIDMVVHSLKDMPTVLPDSFEMGCILAREDPRDALIMKAGSPYKCLADLPAGSVVGTSSVRRSAQLLKNYPHLKFNSVRGNVNSRIRKLDDPESEFSCLILAAAGLIRLGLRSRITKYLGPDEMYHAVGQGALGVEIVKGNKRLEKVCQKISSYSTTLECIAERALMRTLEGGCSVPVGVWTTFNKETNTLDLKSIVLSPDGKESVTDEVVAKVTNSKEAMELGNEIGRRLIRKGAKRILDAINFDKIKEMKQAGIDHRNAKGKK